MISRVVVILAAGESQRWDQGFPKQLAQVNGETIIGRTTRLLLERDVLPVIVTHLPELYSLPGVAILVPGDHSQTINSLWSSRNLWPSQGLVVVLLGDVYYSEDCLDTILGGTDQCQFYGGTHEIFGLAFAPEGLATGVLKLAVGATKRGKRGKLWDFYYAYSGTQPTDPPTRTKCYTLITDGTQDIDTPESYAQLLEKIRDQSTPVADSSGN